MWYFAPSISAPVTWYISIWELFTRKHKKHISVRRLFEISQVLAWISHDLFNENTVKVKINILCWRIWGWCGVLSYPGGHDIRCMSILRFSNQRDGVRSGTWKISWEITSFLSSLWHIRLQTWVNFYPREDCYPTFRLSYFLSRLNVLPTSIGFQAVIYLNKFRILFNLNLRHRN